MNTRRSFLTGGVTALSASRILGANERIRVGMIGTGGRGAFHTMNLARREEVEVVAACDVWRTRAERACEKAGIKAVVVQDHRQVLDRKDVDAVVIAVTDHWHTPILLDALRAGKDAFLEKPMTYRIEEGHEIVKAVRQSGRVVQVGTQQKSGPHFLEAKERFFDSGKIGKVALVRTWWIANRGYLRRPPAGFVHDPKDLDWNRYLGRAPKRPFDAQRYFGWYAYADYSTGQPGGLLVHTADVAHMMLGLSAPSAVVASGGMYEFSSDRDTPDTISILAEYPEKVVVTFDATQSSIRDIVDCEFHGSGGVLNIFRYGYVFRPAEKGAPPVEVKGPPADPPHMTNFLNAVRSRRQPNCDVVYSHYLSMVCHMGNLAYEKRRRVEWKPSWHVPKLG
ncbi:MAG: Gfo/Idh/MocA family oxidoreductase [Acidobacteriota bacterium]